VLVEEMGAPGGVLRMRNLVYDDPGVRSLLDSGRRAFELNVG
jgi:hypothetical protein